MVAKISFGPFKRLRKISELCVHSARGHKSLVMTWHLYTGTKLLQTFQLSKVAELCVKTELAKCIPTDEHQLPYTKGYSTSDALVKIITDTDIILNDKQTYAMQSLLLDFSKAFELMKPDILAAKLLTMKVPVSVVKFVMSFLTERRQRVRFNNQTSPSHHTNLGVPQGTKLGPILWNAYVQGL